MISTTSARLGEMGWTGFFAEQVAEDERALTPGRVATVCAALDYVLGLD